MNGIVIRLAGVPQPETRVFHRELISIGTAPDCDLRFPADGRALPPAATLLSLRLTDGIYRIVGIEPAADVTRHGEAVAVGDPIHDGDTFYFGQTGIRLRLFALSDAMDLTESLELGTAVLAHPDAAGPVMPRVEKRAPRTDVALVFVKQLLRELVAEIPPRSLYLILGAALLVIGTIVYISSLSFLEGRRNNNAIADLKVSLSDLQKEVKRTAEELRQTREDSEMLRSAISVAPKVVESYGPGVCLVYGTYSFTDPRSGREARFREPSEMSAPISSSGSVNLSVDGSGPVYELEFIGTGFMVARGLILTNRHVVQPWHDDPVVSVIRSQGFRPKLKDLYAYFPKTQPPFQLRTLEVDQGHDVALCEFDPGAAELPVLPLDENGEGAVSGRLVVLIGYPAGIEGLLARVEGGDRMDLMRGRMSLRALLNDLASRTQIRPQSTQGHIGDIDPRRLVYDAQTGEGGSGGPVFGVNGKVIGINQAVLPGTPSNFGVPIRFGIELINKHRPPEQAKDEAAEKGLSPASNQKPAATRQ